MVAAGLAEAWRRRLAGDVGERVAQVMTSERDLVHDTTGLAILALLPLRALSLAYLLAQPSVLFTNDGVIANRVRVRVRVRVRGGVLCGAVERGICRTRHCSQRHTCGAVVCSVLTSARPGTFPRPAPCRVPNASSASHPTMRRRVDGEILARLGTSPAAATIEEIDLSRCLALTDADLLQLRWFPRLRCVALRNDLRQNRPTPTHVSVQEAALPRQQLHSGRLWTLLGRSLPSARGACSLSRCCLRACAIAHVWRLDRATEPGAENSRSHAQ